MSPALAAKAEPLQPYHTVGTNEIHALGALATLSNIDKHRVIHVVRRLHHEGVFLAPTPDKFIDCYPDNPVRLETKLSAGDEVHLNDEALSVYVTATGPNPDVKLEPNLTAHIAIHENWNPVDTLDGIRAQVTAILEGFEPLV